MLIILLYHKYKLNSTKLGRDHPRCPLFIPHILNTSPLAVGLLQRIIPPWSNTPPKGAGFINFKIFKLFINPLNPTTFNPQVADVGTNSND
jgi:hypothetical protein